ncbi:hypothetical protein KU306_12095 [Haloferax larsenii]|uniref:Uncharacterized protein n=1 Tax=Haloferax larsenii TaxID=302484 RepID=A0ABY5RC91_HALLR|nr:hypothetical protein [Haloferax larsenii]UVE49645.1 hypothetical protein KU306_12095 [Haloferax larsenii]
MKSDKTSDKCESTTNHPTDGYVCDDCGSEFDTSLTAWMKTWNAPEHGENGLCFRCTGCYNIGVIVYDSEEGGVKRRHGMVADVADEPESDADNIWVAADDNGILMTDGGRDLDAIDADIQHELAGYHDDILNIESTTLVHEDDDAYYVIANYWTLAELNVPEEDWRPVVGEIYTPAVSEVANGEYGDVSAAGYPLILRKED